MLTNATLQRIDSVSGGVFTPGSEIAVRCAVAKAGSLFEQGTSSRQRRHPDVGRLYVFTGALGSTTAINNGFRLFVVPDRRPGRNYIANEVFDRIDGGHLDHFEIDLRDEALGEGGTPMAAATITSVTKADDRTFIWKFSAPCHSIDLAKGMTVESAVPTGGHRLSDGRVACTYDVDLPDTGAWSFKAATTHMEMENASQPADASGTFT